MKRLLSGNQALARGAWQAGVRVAAGYPGTPSTEILETFAPMPDVYAEWCPNEKVALDVAVGASYAGARALVVMKHVGLNVAADALFYVAITGVEAGLLIVVADDPGMHSSQGEQDTRRYGKFARVPVLEPSDSQECLDMVAAGLELSERYDLPVILRTTTRIAHSYGLVQVGAERPTMPQGVKPAYRLDPTKYVMLPGNARHRQPIMEENIRRVAEAANSLPQNRIEPGDRALGIVTSGISYQYAREVFPQASYCRLGLSYPAPSRLLKDFAATVDRVIVIEEGDPVLEEECRLQGIACEGKSIFPLSGELSTKVVRDCAERAGLLPIALGDAALPLTPPPLPARPPVLCPGCPHRGVFTTLRKLKLVVNGDIGCYTLGALPPLGALSSCGCMGASIGVAHGVTLAGVAQRNIAVIGDSTFYHSGIPALLNVAYNHSRTLTVILDNGTTAMTGHQHHPGTGRTLQMRPTPAADLEAVVRALGIGQVRVVDPYDLSALESALQEYLALDEPSVVIARRECALLPSARERHRPLRVQLDKCIACGACRRVGCPAIVKSEQVYAKTGKPKSEIDPLLCTGCEICAQVCPVNAILFRNQLDATEGGANR